MAAFDPKRASLSGLLCCTFQGASQFPQPAITLTVERRHQETQQYRRDAELHGRQMSRIGHHIQRQECRRQPQPPQEFAKLLMAVQLVAIAGAQRNKVAAQWRGRYMFRQQENGGDAAGRTQRHAGRRPVHR